MLVGPGRVRASNQVRVCLRCVRRQRANSEGTELFVFKSITSGCVEDQKQFVCYGEDHFFSFSAGLVLEACASTLRW